MSDEESEKPKAGVGYFNLGELQRQKQASRDRDDADLRDGRVTAGDLRLRNGLFSGIDLSKATIRLGGVEKLRLKNEILARASKMTGKQNSAKWYRFVPISALGGRTAETIVEDGEGRAVLAYLEQKSVGGFD